MGDAAPAIPRLGVPEYHWWNECLHGVGRAGRATVFPQAIGLAATWNPELVFEVANAISDEARAKHHAALRLDSHRIYTGLTFWSPTINLFRDPRWGRGQESYGEDPYLTARLGVAFVKGLQGNDPKYLKVVGTAKHFAAHSGPEEGRAAFDAQVGPKDMEETYLPAFQALIQEGGAASVMGAYNRLNGEACCASPTLLQGILRDKWGFSGYVVSDCGAIENLTSYHKLTDSDAAGAAIAVEAGCDLCCGSAFAGLTEAVRKGLIEEATIDKSLVRLFEARFRLGMFDPEDQVPYSKIPPSVVDSAEHRQLARKAAQESVVLLKNNGLLPLKKNIQCILVSGPNACSLDVLWGNYNGVSSRMVSLLEGVVGIVDEGTRVVQDQGCTLYAPTATEYVAPEWLVGDVEVVIACLGLSPSLEGEDGDMALGGAGGDRQAVALPPNQIEYLKGMAKIGKPIVVVLTAGSPLAMPEVLELADAVVYAWYPGEEGGNAVADVLFGDYNPAGRTPITFPRADQPLPPIEDYSMEGRTYRFSSEEPQNRFGFGLSYTRFEYSDLRISVAPKEEVVRVSGVVTNVGGRDGDEVVQAYVTDLEASTRVPIRQLVGFKRVHVKQGQSQRVEIEIKFSQLTVVLEDGTRKLESGMFEVSLGGEQPSPRGFAVRAILQGQFHVAQFI